MWGSIIGDLAGSIYEYRQIKKVTPITIQKLITPQSFYSDDTILMIAVLEAIIEGINFEDNLKKYGREFQGYRPNFSPYFASTFSPGFSKWVHSNGGGYSTGNGAMMRIAPVGYLFQDEEAIIEAVKQATIPSHHTEEAITSATIVALVIYYARKKVSKERIIQLLHLPIMFEPFSKFNSTCYDTIGNCLYAVFTSHSFEESIKKVISYGGDTDTNACIVGGMAEAMYGIDESLILEVSSKIPDEFVKILRKGYSMMK